ncbi:MAG: thioredoxin-disulfide reductase [Sulfobacillus thermosulfidooxidans]|uniref:Thioredoxin reductase n=1 Tax=Sulfobacillus thermotolerans TaxID=338644 RepID=A0ABM6RPZ9_9FIRM|nr:thioredoxin-disulfide reductase [Sulfobacillus sp. hq2]AUW93341.1 thioredoxin-disulfide reductase [Sulfobacillus thermotolerans]MCY0909118.1 thioredoxin-disulfide reductase [Sulfobacillus thermotolerans]POB10574.1 thioredoxin-disulfide reductase [Sulfobacillus sp. hq2]PSR35671.1 MAG: thioredoxin-disulfide reductase [Sulfobacillus thermosulfidooxidans]
MDRRKVIILGTGPAGLTAAIYAARANLKPLVIEGNEPGGQLTLTTEIENFPGFPDAILGPDLMDNMRKQAERFGAEFVFGMATAVDTHNRPFHVTVNDDEAYTADALIISTGASAKMLGIPGEAELIGHGVSTCATCDGFFFRDKPIIVVGGGDSAMEEASFLTKFASEVTIVHRRETLRASKVMQDRAHANPKIKWAMDQTPIRVVSEDNHVTGLEVQDNKTGQKHIIPAEGLFIAIGHKPNTSFLNNQLKTDKVGYLKTNLHNSATSVEGIFACGDVMDPHYRQAITAAGSGCKAAMDVEKYLEGAFVYDWSMSEPD